VKAGNSTGILSEMATEVVGSTHKASATRAFAAER
jgi:hypothetical protein